MQTFLTDEDRRFFRENGYVRVPGVVDQPQLQAVIDAIWRFLGMDPDDPDDWYREPHRTGGMVELYQHQALWDNRQDPRVHQVFSEVLGTERLWVSMDRASMKPPAHPGHPDYSQRLAMHWDMDIDSVDWERDRGDELAPFGVQGGLCLADTDAEQGGFECVPSVFAQLPGWLESLPEDVDRRRPPFPEDEIVPVPGKAGDLIVWDRRLPHGNGLNASDRPRFAQYITMSPAAEHDEEARQRRIQLWRERLSPPGRAFPGDPRRLEQLHGRTAELTALGRRLLGLDRWER